MKKYLNDKNLKFIAQVATGPEGFNVFTAVKLCIDEWYLNNPINEYPEYNSVARSEFNTLLFGKKFNALGESDQSELMIHALGEFFEEYIAPRYVILQNFTYDFLDNLKLNEPDDIYMNNDSGWTYDDFKFKHFEQIIDLIDDIITDWRFGFDTKEDLEVEEIETICHPIENSKSFIEKTTPQKAVPNNASAKKSDTKKKAVKKTK